MLARVHPHLERVRKPRPGKSRAAPHGFTPEATEMRVHAANWIGAHGHAYRDLATHVEAPRVAASLGATSEKGISVLILVRRKGGGKLKQALHPAKHVLISRTTGRIRGEQG